MSTPVNVHQAKTHFFQAVGTGASRRGDHHCQSGATYRQNRAHPTRKKPREPGTAKGKIWIAPDFDEPLPEEILKAFEGA